MKPACFAPGEGSLPQVNMRAAALAPLEGDRGQLTLAGQVQV